MILVAQNDDEHLLRMLYIQPSSLACLPLSCRVSFIYFSGSLRVKSSHMGFRAVPSGHLPSSLCGSTAGLGVSSLGDSSTSSVEPSESFEHLLISATTTRVRKKMALHQNEEAQMGTRFVVLVVSYSAVTNYVFVIQHDVPSALEVFQCFGCCLFYLPQIGYQESGIDYRLVFCKYVCLKHFYDIFLVCLGETGKENRY